MSDSGLEQTQSPLPIEHETKQPAALAALVAPASGKPGTASQAQKSERNGTVEHLAARRPVTPLNAEAPEVKQRLSDLRTELTTLVTDFRWGGVSTQATADALIPLLNLGNLQQWTPILIPYILEIDRAGNLIPVWLKIIEQDDPSLSADANPAETTIGRARRIATLMLGNYKSAEISFELGKLATDPSLSLYATEALSKQATTAALQALITALKEAEGWAKVDIVEACLNLKQPLLHEFILSSGLERVTGIESYIAVPIYRSITLERYLRGGNGVAPKLSEQAALVFGHILHDTLNNPIPTAGSLPILFEVSFPPLAIALFEGTRTTPGWQNVLATHRLAQVIGRYWADILRGALQDARIVQPIQACLPMMPDIERWMNGPGRDVLLQALTGTDEEAFTPIVKVLGELRDPRTFNPLVAHLDATSSIADREQANLLSQICDALGRLGDRRATSSLLQLAKRILNVDVRMTRTKRKDNLAAGDAEIPASIVYAAILRAAGQLADPSTLDLVLKASGDFDPYVRTQALEALKRIDATGENKQSRFAVREALNDPRDTVVRVACQLIAQYRDNEATSLLQQLAQTRSELAPIAFDTLRKLG